MKTTIDRAGRVVIPAELRLRAGLKPGTEVEVILQDDGDVRLVPSVAPPRFERVDGWWHATPTVPESERTPVDLLEEIDASRERCPT